MDDRNRFRFTFSPNCITSITIPATGTMRKTVDPYYSKKKTDPIAKTKTTSSLEGRGPSSSYTEGVPSQRLSNKWRKDAPVKTDARRVIMDPKEIIFLLDGTAYPEEREPLVIRNLGPTPMFFRSRSTNMEELRPNPHIGFIAKFDSLEVIVMFKSNKPDKYLKRVPDRLTFEWIRLGPEAVKKDMEKHSKQLQNTPKEERYKRSLTITYKITLVNNVSTDDIALVKSAFVGTPSTLTMVGDFESENVSADFSLMNRSTRNAEPKNGILQPSRRIEVTITAKKFHVGAVADICDTAYVEWTAAAPEITEFSMQAVEDVAKVFRVCLTIFYEYTGINENTQRSESFRQSKPRIKRAKRLQNRLSGRSE